MARRKAALWVLWKTDDGHISKTIHQEFELYAKDTGFYPTQHALYAFMTEGVWNDATRAWQEPRYSIARGLFDYWFKRLVDEHYIAVDDRTRAIKSTGLEIREKEDRNTDLD